MPLGPEPPPIPEELRDKLIVHPPGWTPPPFNMTPLVPRWRRAFWRIVGMVRRG